MPKTGLRPAAWDPDSSDAGYQLLDAIAARDMSRAQGLLMAKVDVNRGMARADVIDMFFFFFFKTTRQLEGCKDLCWTYWDEFGSFPCFSMFFISLGMFDE